ncbi:MAG TPA: hypothetical protein VLU54_18105, partial [Casimicrobiaceae bacterium]|nr:hypothetical protein [Casimicrobiaceae bacterium]
AVEMVWGTGEAEDVGHSGPIVLDDVPDVSEKHLAPRAPPRQARQRSGGRAHVTQSSQSGWLVRGQS